MGKLIKLYVFHNVEKAFQQTMFTLGRLITEKTYLLSMPLMILLLSLQSKDLGEIKLKLKLTYTLKSRLVLSPRKAIKEGGFA